MDRKEYFEDLVVKGFVLDPHSNWKPIAEQIKKEKEFLNFLQKGYVLHKGEWIRIDEAKKLKIEKTESSEDTVELMVDSVKTLHSEANNVVLGQGTIDSFKTPQQEVSPAEETALIVEASAPETKLITASNDDLDDEVPEKR